MRPAYLTGERIYLRAMLASDAEQATAWSCGPFPINASRAEAVLKETHRQAWGGADPLHLAIVRLPAAGARDGGAGPEHEDPAEEIVGGAELAEPRGRRGRLALRFAPSLSADEADSLRAEALGIVVPWARDELELMTVTIQIPADGRATIAAADALGMIRAVRLREAVLRPGHRVDLFYYQALNPRWAVGPGDSER
ncbi:MAG: hypothetical protein AVDCRST_MAG49-2870 [uncultured Thermomicrobiales bacterium]|uniref:N-acetyltransferase domain-containing protein n=1 Tax=uncultured Thermomicrobiales bacterium TaxID=1645740 RepID=A0A6J4UQF7_9BACT|nr:MAG: hypothetical protein AVDCRST_MAG49-2870 [uncultured Thermomicrobiales bacterium]